LITGRSKQRDTGRRDLVELGVDALHVLVRRDAVALRNLALLRLGPAPRDRHHVGFGRAREEIVGKLLHPVLCCPVPVGRVERERRRVLNVELRLEVGRRALIPTKPINNITNTQ
jgi:hypothetical protein